MAAKSMEDSRDDTNDVVESSESKTASKYSSGVYGVQYLLTFFILGAAWIVAFFSRLFAVVRFESIIHEFDPW